MQEMAGHKAFNGDLLTCEPKLWRGAWRHCWAIHCRASPSPAAVPVWKQENPSPFSKDFPTGTCNTRLLRFYIIKPAHPFHTGLGALCKRVHTACPDMQQQLAFCFCKRRKSCPREKWLQQIHPPKWRKTAELVSFHTSNFSYVQTEKQLKLC